tara:strand:- start:6791 stop:6979 length:189 start_codon:yes stop_codon:yes gene_type:complete
MIYKRLKQTRNLYNVRLTNKSIMSEIITLHDAKVCDFCKDNMIELQVGRYKCLSCGAKEDQS